MEKSILHTHPALLSHPLCWCWCWDRAAGLVKPGFVLSFKVQQESAMLMAVLQRPCTRWPSLRALCPPALPAPSTSQLPTLAWTSWVSFSRSLLSTSFLAACAPTSSSQWALSYWGAGDLAGLRVRARWGWHRSLAVFWHTSCQQCKTDLWLFAWMFSSFPGFPAVLLQYN